jgi:hypothetical protein
MKFFSKEKEASGPAYQHPIEERLAALIEVTGFTAAYSTEYCVFELNIAGDNCRFRSIVYYLPDTESIGIRSYLPFEMRDSSKLKLAEFFMRVNLRLHFGSVKMDFENGSCYYDTPHLLQPTVLEEEVFKQLFLTNINTADEVFVHALNVNLGNDEPITAALKFLER